MAADAFLQRSILECISLHIEWHHHNAQQAVRVVFRQDKPPVLQAPCCGSHCTSLCSGCSPAGSGKFVLICGICLILHDMACDTSMWQNTDFKHFASGDDFLVNSRQKRHFWLCLH